MSRGTFSSAESRHPIADDTGKGPGRATGSLRVYETKGPRTLRGPFAEREMPNPWARSKLPRRTWAMPSRSWSRRDRTGRRSHRGCERRITLQPAAQRPLSMDRGQTGAAPSERSPRGNCSRESLTRLACGVALPPIGDLKALNRQCASGYRPSRAPSNSSPAFEGSGGAPLTSGAAHPWP